MYAGPPVQSTLRSSDKAGAMNITQQQRHCCSSQASCFLLTGFYSRVHMITYRISYCITQKPKYRKSKNLRKSFVALFISAEKRRLGKARENSAMLHLPKRLVCSYLIHACAIASPHTPARATFCSMLNYIFQTVFLCPIPPYLQIINRPSDCHDS